ncbi:collagenase [Austwickia chelonae]|uniref:microbial collagenase n=1 Tax=Austwickia chelonae NBRC 105200 TaxID=1184607 RepID=K6VUJ0_9MICO|nr:collagenase [Austwickia chelonae]GAB78980.1 putative peptidase [Austwickia chelonae NBRC 105200]
MLFSALLSFSLAVPVGAGAAPVTADDTATAPATGTTGPDDRSTPVLPDIFSPKAADDLPVEDRRTRRPSLDRPATASAPTRTDQGGTRQDPRLRSLPRADPRSCRSAEFAGLTGAALAAKVASSTTDCINTLFYPPSGEVNALFRESQMAAVADELRRRAASYTGQGDDGVAQLVLYLRAGYYVQYGHSALVGNYSSALSTSVRAALDTFFARSQAWQVTESNGVALAEAVTLIDSAQLNAHYLPVLKKLLTSYGPGHDRHRSMILAVNNTYTVFFRGHQLPAFVQAVAADPSVLVLLRDFAVNHVELLAGDNHFLVTNAGRELARFLGDPAVKAAAKPLVVDLLSKTQITGRTAPLYAGVGAMAQDLDRAACADYGTCDLANRLKKVIFPTTVDCSDSLRFVAQTTNPADLDDACRSLRGQDAFFHRTVRDPGPLAGDRNQKLEINVFNSPNDYRWYGNAIFNIDTDNGGMYLEGDPHAENNQARFIAYRAPWLKPGYQIWNLNHEYTHYLDGRFNMFGSFEENMKTPTIWWVEGIAEYVSYTYRGIDYSEAISEAARPRYRLSTLFDTTYKHDTNRIYRWSYLATRFMLEEHPREVDTVLNYYRQGDWDNARHYLTRSIGTAYDDEFADWLKRCAAGACRAKTPEPAPALRR